MPAMLKVSVTNDYFFEEKEEKIDSAQVTAKDKINYILQSGNTISLAHLTNDVFAINFTLQIADFMS